MTWKGEKYPCKLPWFAKSLRPYRSLTFIPKLVSIGIPRGFTKIIDRIYCKIKVSIKNEDKLSKKFVTSVGVLSLPSHVYHLCQWHEELVETQRIISRGYKPKVYPIHWSHCPISWLRRGLANGTEQHKCLLERKSPSDKCDWDQSDELLPEKTKTHNFTFDGDDIEMVKTFKYLGFHLSPQPSWPTIWKEWYQRLDQESDTCLPICHYEIYLKRYLVVLKHSNNAITYHLTKSIPFSFYMRSRIQKSISILRIPKELHGTKFTFLENSPPLETIKFNNFERIPSWFFEFQEFSKDCQPEYCKILLKMHLDTDTILSSKSI